MGPAETTQFLTAPAVAGHVSASTQNHAFAALLFLYREVFGRDPGWLQGIVRANVAPHRRCAVVEVRSARAGCSDGGVALIDNLFTR